MNDFRKFVPKGSLLSNKIPKTSKYIIDNSIIAQYNINRRRNIERWGAI